MSANKRPTCARHPAARCSAGMARPALLIIVLICGLLTSGGWYLWKRFGSSEELFNIRTAPNVKVEALSSNWWLRGQRFDEFDIAPNGSIVVRSGKSLYDLASGKKLVDEKFDVLSFAFVHGSLAIATNGGKLAYWTGDSLHEVGDAPSGARLRSTEKGDRLLLSGGETDYALFSLAAQSEPQSLCGSPEPILAAAGDEAHYLFAVGRSLFEMRERGRPFLLLTLPDLSTDINGLAINGESIYFASSNTVYALRGWLAVPLVMGIGGQLRWTSDGLLVLDSKRGRLYRIWFAGNSNSGNPATQANTSTPSDKTTSTESASGNSSSNSSGSSSGSSSANAPDTSSGASSSTSTGLAPGPIPTGTPGIVTPSLPKVQPVPTPIMIPRPEIHPVPYTPVVPAPARPYTPPPPVRTIP